ncbi:DUF4245 domain-containing protein [Mumia sp. ZJ1417]|uniref:DUF4245 domain-containing protein n=1 Tax=unclassified Mumia TaxID=2621872 RepID=UPI001421744B|nr:MULTISPECIES: DUF4245 domain-containing protein [unclassified Mumia]QMW67212.1 DUF4245 domain-containing protein [Mumia sp. ZJ1417]
MSSTDPSPTPGQPTQEQPTPEPDQAPAKPRSTYGNPAFADIARSMGVLAVIVVGLYLAGQFFWGNTPDERPPVAYEQTVEDVRQTAPYPVYSPTSLPDGWRANGVTFKPGESGRWHLGVLTEDDRYIGLEQALDSAPRMIEAYAPGVEQRADVEVAGKTWQLWTGGGETTFVREEGEMTVLVTGPAPREDIERFMGLLSSE